MARIAKYSRLRLAPAVGVALALVLSGCAAGQVSQTANQVAAIDGANGTVGSLGVRDVLFVSTQTGGYKAGADLPMRLWVSNSSVTPDTLTGISSPAATTIQIEGAADIPAQSLVQFTTDSAVKITLMGLTQDLPYGHSIPLTFTFATAGSVQVNVPIEIPTERVDTSRETVNILPAEHGNIWFGGEGGTTEAGSN